MQGNTVTPVEENPILQAAPATKKDTQGPMGFRPDTQAIRQLIENEAAETGKSNSKIINELITKGIEADKQVQAMFQKAQSVAQKLAEAQERITQLETELEAMKQAVAAPSKERISVKDVVKHCFNRAQSYGYFGSLKHLETGLTF
ncbi:hypothetical protein QNI19_16530 [Cytophagaceae bacterium DM2B3-1]|uniref:Arc-like DNA binding domain-containing protein n=1 Tax=Xanthocytophaga flava TaxID=3048013 RepID=A0ABT7CLC2_9BACT|nr:hypothetical protein [Xanthocytophaga flavus]MDJ1494553.1 hypothetical protein [Xanthocytophaga flavus]